MNMAVETEENTISLEEVISIFLRRKNYIIYSFIVIFLIAVLLALFLPPTYRSSATILIEEQEIPKDLIRSTVTSYVEQQIQVINQRIMTQKNIMELVEKYKLYTEDELKRKYKTEISREFRDQVVLDTVSADVRDPLSGRPGTATIAFTLSFDHKSPKKAQSVANELVNLYLNENLRSRTEKTVNASAFLKSEAEGLAGLLEGLESALAVFKQENEGALPEMYQYNQTVLDRLDTEIAGNKLQLSGLEQRKADALSRLAQLSPYSATVLPTGERALGDQDRLKALESEYRRKSSVYSDTHPDVQRLAREISSLKAHLGEITNLEDKKKILMVERDVLSGLKQQYRNDHPEVLRQNRIIEQLEADIANAAPAPVAEVKANDPSYVLLENRIFSIDTEIQYLKDKNRELREKSARYEKFILRGPLVEQQYRVLQRDYANAQAKYQEIKEKQLSAELAQNLEQGRKGDRFTLIQPPVLPEQPISPNRMLILAVGLVFAGMVGLGLGLLVELLDSGIRGEAQVAALLGASPLVTIPYIYIDSELKTVNAKKYIAIVIFIAAIFMAVLSIHFFYKPLDVLWFLVMRKYGLAID